MTRIINIKTSKYQLSTAFRWVLMLPCLLVMLSGCFYPQTAATGVSVTNFTSYQTGRTLKQGVVTLRFDVPKYSPAMTNKASLQGGFLNLRPAFGVGIASEVGLFDEWQIGGSANVSTSLVEDYGFTGDGGYSCFTKVKLPFFQEHSSVAMAAMLDYTTLQGSYGIGEAILSNGTVRFSPLPIWTGTLIPAIPIRLADSLLPRGLDTNTRLLDTNIRWDVSSRLQNISLAFPISLKIQASTDFTIRPALHYSSYSLTGTQRVKIVTDLGKVVSDEEKNLSSKQNLFIPSLSLGYSIRDTLTNVEGLHFEITGSVWNGTPTFAFGVAFRVPIYLIPYDTFLQRSMSPDSAQ